MLANHFFDVYQEANCGIMKFIVNVIVLIAINFFQFAWCQVLLKIQNNFPLLPPIQKDCKKDLPS